MYLHEAQTRELRKEKYFKPMAPSNVGFKIGFIGCGSMGRVILDSLLDYIPPEGAKSKQNTLQTRNNFLHSLNTHQELMMKNSKFLFSPSSIVISTRRPQHFLNHQSMSLRYSGKKYAHVGVNVLDDNFHVANNCDLVFLCIQPSQVKFALLDFKSPTKSIVCSMIVGLTVDSLEKNFKNPNIVCCDSPSIVESAAMYDADGLLYIHPTDSIFDNYELIKAAIPQVYNHETSVPEDQLIDRREELNSLKVATMQGKQLQTVSFFERLFASMVSAFETTIPFEEAIRLALDSILNLDISTSTILIAYQEIVEENLFSKEKHYKTVHFVKKV